ncbi:hypothetical protein NDR87_02885 [Nocardia sp. CDC159]|uniref:SnoaL-like domain-containing protein n=1 Tax=Nocardia pulmonis TaxID=2951408 RepID=A0A9X2ITQ8_9NOCA|nr:MULTISPECIES: hypothetical protein [Nocardia]MCM6772042.1 hypothetical protein [Nocardia pulmonis]MCM6785300.1 hypothetical protein [Nocardia sp. CDC159]
MNTPRSVDERGTRGGPVLPVADPTGTEPASEVLEKYLPLLTEDAVVELHAMPPELPTRLVGHDELRAAVARLSDYDLRVTGLAAAEPLLDPDTWLVFARGEFIVRSTGAIRDEGYVFALRLRAGRIAHCACYRDPLAVPATEPTRRGLLSPLGFGLRRRRRGQAPTDRLR